jgi:hypothetical protein
VNPTLYRVLCAYADSYLLRPHPWPIPAISPFPVHFTTAVYIAVGPDGQCQYVGSAWRPNGAMSERIAEHLRDPVKRATWHAIWVIPLQPDMPRAEVRRLEGVVGAHLRPRQSRRLPAPGLPAMAPTASNEGAPAGGGRS